jgi:mannosyltransferase
MTDTAFASTIDRIPIANRRLEWSVAVIATLTAVAAYGVFLTHGGALWRDEANTVTTASAPSLARMWQLMEFESFPVAWPSLERAWVSMGAGSTDASLRLLGVLGGLSLVPAMWLASLRLGRRPPLVGLALVAVNPEIVRWSASVRAWGLGAALAIVAFALVADAARLPSRGRIVAAAIAAVLSVHCVYQNAVLIGAIVGATVLVAVATGAWRGAAVALGIGAISALTLVPYSDIMERRSVWNVVMQNSITLGQIARKAYDVTASSGAAVGLCWTGLVVAAIGVVVTERARRERIRHRDALYAVWVAVLTAIGLAVLYLAFRLPTQSWYYLGGLTLIVSCADISLAICAPPVASRAASVGALLILAVGVIPTLSLVRQPQTNIDAVAGYLNHHASTGDLVLVDPWYVGVSLHRYYSASGDVQTIPPMTDYSVHRYDLLRQSMLSANSIDPLLNRVRQTLQAGHRVWEISEADSDANDGAAALLPPWDGRSNADPYQRQWSLQIRAVLDGHAARRETVALIPPGGPLESTGLSVASGWQE